jgi:hypothetical protein
MLELLDTTGNSVQIVLVLLFALAFFMVAIGGYARAIFIGLIIMIPFQPITSMYGTMNMAVTYLLAPALFLENYRNRSKPLQATPLIVPFALLLLAYMISWAAAPTYKVFASRYFFYMLQMGSNVALFYMSYVYFRAERDLNTFFKALIFSNFLVLLYSTAQVFVGDGQLSLFGIEELSIQQNRKDQRLGGPFNAVGITAEYLVIQSLILGHYIVQTGKLRRFGMLMLLGNIGILIGTGNRGGFLCAILAAGMFLYINKRYIGMGKVLLAAAGFVLFILVSSFVMIKYTNYNVLYERLLGTEVEGVTPDSRSGWTYVVEKIPDNIVTGHGPNIVMRSEFWDPPSRNEWPDLNTYITYFPHSLYLFILYTTGVVGFLAYGYWALNYWLLLVRERRRKRFRLDLGIGLPTIGMIIFIIFLIDQLKVEFIRFNLLDYQHYIASLFGMFAALGNIPADTSAAESHSEKPRRRGLLDPNRFANASGPPVK